MGDLIRYIHKFSPVFASHFKKCKSRYLTLMLYKLMFTDKNLAEEIRKAIVLPTKAQKKESLAIKKKKSKKKK